MLNKHDVVIVGSGMVGASCALDLALAGLNVAIVSPDLPAEPTNLDIDDEAIEKSLRYSALNQASINAFIRLGIWPIAAAAYQDMLVWDKNSVGQIHFSASDVGTEQLGYICNNLLVQQALLKRLAELNNCQFYSAKVSQIDNSQGNPLLQLDDNKLLQSRFLIAADGANSKIRQWLDLPLSFSDYGQDAIVANVWVDQPHENTARQIFTPTGPLALLPLQDTNLCSIVWSQNRETAQSLMALDDAEFNRRLTAAFDAHLGLIELASERVSYSLMARYAQNFIQGQSIIMGDAAHTIHPLAGQGANLGLLDAFAFAQTLTAHWQDDDAKLAVELRKTMRWRQADALERLAAMEVFKRTFSNDFTPVKLLRAAVMNGLNQIKPAKSQMSKVAMGLTGKLPDICLPE
ncbi:ubiquinone biosynthesis visC protein [Catenovulum agarivorans DS-2]|uniref:Ubiquinone biosynthesis visC protein n=1 Tax=Catenovulum agarivorans DS-2 TaxID=1328313 RepID=W7QQK1_9ALTE|nr:FAD-dependent oxidoreductase [Catenovulum agarivorans]EWH10158.1 ubiquinone biosynthesis visC protein [Catenovulum agarivorans DS-2]